MDTIILRVDQHLTVIDKQLEQYEILQTIHTKTGIRISLLTAIIALSGSMLCFIFCGPALLTNIIGCAYPLYKTLNLILSHSDEEYAQMMMYWTIFGFFYCFESLFEDVSKYFPLFYPFKLSLLLTCLSSDINLAKVIYNSIAVEYFGMPDLSQQKRIEKVNQIKEKIKEEKNLNSNPDDEVQQE